MMSIKLALKFYIVVKLNRSFFYSLTGTPPPASYESPSADDYGKEFCDTGEEFEAPIIVCST